MLSQRLLNDFPRNYIVFGRKSVTVHGQTRRSTNHLLRVRKEIDGLKTGFTTAAGYNLAATERRDGDRVVAIVFGASSRKSRDAKMLSLLDLGFERIAEARDLTTSPRPRRRPDWIGDVAALSVASVPAAERRLLRDGADGRDRATLKASTPRRNPRRNQVQAPTLARATSAWSIQVRRLSGARPRRGAARARSVSRRAGVVSCAKPRGARSDQRGALSRAFRRLGRETRRRSLRLAYAATRRLFARAARRVGRLAAGFKRPTQPGGRSSDTPARPATLRGHCRRCANRPAHCRASISRCAQGRARGTRSTP